jgi:O-antigen/teichoic acid export membrane protein
MSEAIVKTQWSLISALSAASSYPIIRRLGHPVAYSLGAAMITAMSAGTTLAAPILLTPEAFGRFSVLATIFQFASSADFGLSQLTDKMLATTIERGSIATALLEIRGALGLALGLLGLGVLGVMRLGTPEFDWIDPALAFLGGVAAMVAVGPLTIYRARSRIFDFTALALILQLGMTAPRLTGLWLHGVSGCYGALLIWYGGLLALFSAGRLLSAPSIGGYQLIRRAFPLFVYATAFPCFLFAGRWIAVLCMSPQDAGFFSFGANLVQIVVGTIATIGQVVYPRLLASRRDSGIEVGSRKASVAIAQLGLVLFGLIGFGLLAVPWGVTAIFPKFVLAVPCVLILGPSILPLAIASWLLPMTLSLTRQPIIDCVLVFSPAVASLVLASLWLSRSGDILTLAIGATLASFLFCVTLIVVSQLHQVMKPRDAALSIVGIMAAVALLGYESLLVMELS